MIKIDKERIEAVIAELSRDVTGMCCSASMYVGKTRSGKVVKLTVMDADEAEDDGFDGDHADLICWE